MWSIGHIGGLWAPLLNCFVVLHPCVRSVLGLSELTSSVKMEPKILCLVKYTNVQACHFLMIRMTLFSSILMRRFLKIFLLSRLRLLSHLSLLLCHASLLSAASSPSEKSDSERDESFRKRDLLRDRRCCNFSAPFPLGLSTKARDLLLLS